MIDAPFLPQPVTDAQLIAPGDVTALLPTWEAIPEEFRRYTGTVWHRVFEMWFYRESRGLELTAQPGIDGGVAMRHLATIMRSFRPSFEHRRSAIAYLLSLWFVEDPAWQPKPAESKPAEVSG